MKNYTLPGPRSQELFDMEQEHIAPGLQSFALHSQLAMAQGRNCTLIDEDGNEYIDFIAGIGVGSIGHCHPHYIATLKQQMENLTFGSFTTKTRAKFLKLLASLTPEGLTRIQLYSGGSEAVEAAFRLAKSVTKDFEFIGFWGGFHGKTGGVLGLLGDDFKHQLGPFMPGLYSSPYANCYRCPWDLRYPDCGIACADHLRRVIKYQTQGQIAAIIVEPIQGTAGNVIPPNGFLNAIQSIAKENDALLIADEMLTGFGRSGSMWGCNHQNIVPDVITVGKGIGGGFPMSGLISTDSLSKAKPFANPSGSSSSYGGNPFASAAGLASLEIIVKENLVDNSAQVGAVMLEKLQSMKEKYRFIGDVRGKGLMLGLELVKDQKTKEPLSKEITLSLFHQCLRRGLISMSYSPVIRINPPLTIDKDTALEGLEILDESMAAMAKEWGLD